MQAFRPHLPDTRRQGLRSRCANRRQRQAYGAAPSVRRRQDLDARMASAACRILKRARFDLDALF